MTKRIKSKEIEQTYSWTNPEYRFATEPQIHTRRFTIELAKTAGNYYVYKYPMIRDDPKNTKFKQGEYIKGCQSIMFFSEDLDEAKKFFEGVYAKHFKNGRES